MRTCSSAIALARNGTVPHSLPACLEDPFAAGLISALSEIFNNVVLHSGSASFWMSVEVRGLEVTLRTSDGGDPADLSRVADPDLEAIPDRGMGVFIARCCVDELEYHPGPPNVWVMRKTRKKDQRDDAIHPRSK